MLRVIALLIFSNVFMTFAWYGHLKQMNVPIWKAIVVSWLIALFEYCLMVPANRIGYQSGVTAFQLKMAQEIVSFVLLLGAVYFMFKK
jgi:uncharacterized protein